MDDEIAESRNVPRELRDMEDGEDVAVVLLLCEEDFLCKWEEIPNG
eukprot:CAMPEP_0202031888 /NCGR_PEP_ID=MMETSP0905-20130828/65247_1 /ASSEMBLY_ACC=CAM_ASM_000554 /TAXON_ID=420261 /ORGANISM="Thalassiosira antarctica, Strain CCMP982" /LENGTH=45 /DNA_ID= /DNA_START= /DNA_END= /DNA_ORIENTATION=